MPGPTWIDGIRHVGGGEWVVDLVDDGLSSKSVPAQMMYKFTSNSKTITAEWCADRNLAVEKFRLVDSDLTTWEPVESSFAAEIIAKAAPTKGNHLVFECATRRRRVHLPSALLMSRLCSPLQHSMPHLLTLQGLETFCIPTLDRDEPGVWFERERLNARSRQRNENSRILSWIWSFPSARQMWDSVAEFANLGKIGLTLPKARISLAGTGIVYGDTLVATNFSVSKIICLEEPFPFSSWHPRDLTICNNGSRTKTSLRSWNALSRPLSDEEWSRIEQFFCTNDSRISRKEPLRNLVDAIHRKYSYNTPWRSIELDSSSWKNAHIHYLKWTKSGTWQAAHTRLAEFISASHSPRLREQSSNHISIGKTSIV
jgi:hypothetical protein